MENERIKFIKKISNFLREIGYKVYELFFSSFDILAISENKILIKYLENVDSLTLEQAEDLKKFAWLIDASCVLISKKTSRSELKDGIIYFRFSLPVLNFKTFKIVIRNKGNFSVFSKKGKVMCFIDVKKLKKLRKEKKYSLKLLAEKIKISKKCLYEIENKINHPSLSTLKKLEKILGENLLSKESLFNLKPSFEKFLNLSFFEKKIFQKLLSLNLDAVNFRKTNFRIGVKNKELKIIGYLLYETNYYKIKRIENESEKLEKIACTFLLSKNRTKCSIPLITFKQLMRIKNQKEFKNNLFKAF